jgi:hypothetical protein
MPRSAATVAPRDDRAAAGRIADARAGPAPWAQQARAPRGSPRARSMLADRGVHRLLPRISLRRPPPRRAAPLASPWWSSPVDEVARGLATDGAGLTSAEAAARLRRFGPNTLAARAAVTRRVVLWRQLRNPLLLLLVFAAAASLATAAWVDAAIVTVIFCARPETEFERSQPPLRVPADDAMLVVVVAVLRRRTSCWVGRRSTTLLFAIALAVGLSPELLPAILSGQPGARRAKRWRRQGVMVRRLERHREPRQHGCAVHRQDRHADRGRRRLDGAWDGDGRPRRGGALAYINAALRDRLANPLDDAILAAAGRRTRRACASSTRSPTTSRASGCRSSVRDPDRRADADLTKGALAQVLALCTPAPADGRPPSTTRARRPRAAARSVERTGLPRARVATREARRAAGLPRAATSTASRSRASCCSSTRPSPVERGAGRPGGRGVAGQDHHRRQPRGGGARRARGGHRGASAR